MAPAIQHARVRSRQPTRNLFEITATPCEQSKGNMGAQETEVY